MISLFLLYPYKDCITGYPHYGDSVIDGPDRDKMSVSVRGRGKAGEGGAGDLRESDGRPMSVNSLLLIALSRNDFTNPICS